MTRFQPIVEMQPSRSKNCAHEPKPSAFVRGRLYRVYLAAPTTKFSKCDSPAGLTVEGVNYARRFVEGQGTANQDFSVAPLWLVNSGAVPRK